MYRFNATRFEPTPPLGPPPVTERTFDEYHLYTLPRPTTLHDRETKQVEFLRAMGCRAYQGFCFSPAVPADDTERQRAADLAVWALGGIVPARTALAVSISIRTIPLAIATRSVSGLALLKPPRTRNSSKDLA